MKGLRTWILNRARRAPMVGVWNRPPDQSTDQPTNRLAWRVHKEVTLPRISTTSTADFNLASRWISLSGLEYLHKYPHIVYSLLFNKIGEHFWRFSEGHGWRNKYLHSICTYKQSITYKYIYIHIYIYMYVYVLLFGNICMYMYHYLVIYVCICIIVW